MLNSMLVTEMLKLAPDSSHQAALRATVRACNAATSYAANVAFQHRTASKIAVQKLCYQQLRATYGVSAQMAIRAISKACAAYKRDPSIRPTFRDDGAVAYDPRILTFKGRDRISILTLQGRILVPVVYQGRWLAKHPDRVRGEAELVYRDGTFYLAVVIDVPEPPQGPEPDAWLGVDLGIKNLATDHVISKQLVDKAQDTRSGIALENLEGIRERVTVSKAQRADHHSWGFAQLRGFVTYKAAIAGVPVRLVDPRNTSRTCPVCGHCAKQNRKTRDVFQCVRCGFAGPADHIAAVNIGRRAVRHAADDAA